MKDKIEINRPEDIKEPVGKTERREPKRRKVNKWGLYISICFIVVGLFWYAINLGIIPMEFIKQQAGPILLVLLGILILIKSL